jgi:hydroxymethylbilane synthase
MDLLRIATRRSALALWQAEHVATRLRAEHPRLAVELLPMTTRGDEIQDRALATLGGKGLFLKELEHALADGRADLAVHSLKDVPANLEPGFELAAILERADAADALVGAGGLTLAALPAGARVGSSSLRRQAQLRAARPDLVLGDLRGNVNTRLARLDAGDYDAIVLACAGLDRLGLSARIGARLAPPDWLPGVGQGAIAIETRLRDHRVAALVSPLHHADTASCVAAERALNRTLAGDCTVPIGAWARLDGDRLQLWGLVGDPISGECVRGHAFGRSDDPEALARTVAGQLRAFGADRLLAGHRPAR